MKIRRRTALITVSAAVCVSAAAVYAFSPGTDEYVAVPVPDAKVAGYCADLHAQLPAEVNGLSRHDLKPASDLTAGWGDPAIVLRCGVPRPAADNSTATDGVDVDGVGWSIEPQPGGSFRLTTTLRQAYVEVTLPKKWAGDLGPLTDLAGPVKKTIPVI